MKRRLMFINAINPSKEIETMFPPLGLGYLISSLKQEFGQDSINFKVIDRDIGLAISEFKPDIIGITSVSQNYNRAIESARVAKRHELPVIMGGIHISALPSTLTKDMDVGVIGEGEQTIVELLDLFDRKEHFNANELEKIAGIAFRRNGDLIVTKERDPIEPLDNIPMPDRSLFAITTSTSMFTSRGCPYRCTFCASSRFWNKVRLFSAEYVVNEIEYLVKKYNVKGIGFWDDLFVISRPRITQILNLLRKKGILDKLSFSCNARANLVNEELVQLLEQMNMGSVNMGLESGSPTTLEYLKGENVNIGDNINALRILRNHKVKAYGTFIIGSPMESREDIMQTFKFVKENYLTDFEVYALTPFPGTPIWDYARGKNLVSEDMDWGILNVNFGESHHSTPILSERLTRDEIYKLFLLFRMERMKRTARSGLKNPLKVFRHPKVALRTLRIIVRQTLGNWGARYRLFCDKWHLYGRSGFRKY